MSGSGSGRSKILILDTVGSEMASSSSDEEWRKKGVEFKIIDEGSLKIIGGGEKKDNSNLKC